MALAVFDAGVGLPPHAGEQSFDPSCTTREPGHGTGLGFTQNHGPVKQHGGHLGRENPPGRGTTFAVCPPGATAVTTDLALPK